MEKSTKDFLTHPGAHELAGVIRAFWAEKGHVVHVSVLQEGHEDTQRQRVLSVVRSNLFNGLPRKLAGTV
jgi:hypothetical protein